MHKSKRVAVLGVPGPGGKALQGYLDTLLAKYGGVYWSLQELSGSVSEATNTALDEGRDVLIDGDMEAPDTSAWTSASAAILTKETGTPHGGARCLRIATGAGDPSGQATQTILQVGASYRVTGFARSDGSAIPSIYTSVSVWAGTNSTDWQEINVEFVAGLTELKLAISGTEKYVEFDDLSVTQLDIPADDSNLDGSITGATVGQDAGRLGRAYLFDGVNDYVDVYSAELNSLFRPDEGTIIVFIRVSGAGVWSDGVNRRVFHLRADSDNFFLLSKVTNTLELRRQTLGSNKTVNSGAQSSIDWQHVAITFSVDGDEMRGYLNGSQIGSTLDGLASWSGNLASNAAVIGSLFNTGSNNWDGYLCHVALFRGVLTPAEILRIAQLGGVA